MPKANVRIIDRGYSRIQRDLAQLAHSREVRVGIQGSEALATRDSGINNATLGAVHEYGSLKNPQRSFISSTVDENNYYIDSIEHWLDGVVKGTISVDALFRTLGEQVAKDIIAKINSNIPPPNSQATQARKHGKGTLVDTGEMRDAVSWVVK